MGLLDFHTWYLLPPLLHLKRFIYETAKNEVSQIMQLMTAGHRCCMKNSNPFYKRTKKGINRGSKDGTVHNSI